MAESPTTFSTSTTAEPLRLQAINLPEGWSGTVVTGWGRDELRRFGLHGLPTADDWQSGLHEIVHAPSTIPGYKVLKYSNKGEVFCAQLTGSGATLQVVCKHSRVDGAWRRFLALWRTSRERADFDRGLALVRAGIATALPLAVIERKAFRREARLITQLIPDAVDLDQVALTLLPQLEPERRRAVKDAIVKALVDLFDRLERNGFHHRDLKASNILLTDWDCQEDAVRVWLVDLEGLRLHGAGSGRRRQPLIRLAASLLDYATVTRTDFCRFVQRYRARTGMPGDTWKQYFRELAAGATAYVRRAQRRKTHKLDGYEGDS